MFGKYVYVSVNDIVPTFLLNQMPYFAQVSDNGAFWVAILEKSWSKIWGSYEVIEKTNVFYLNL